MTSLIIEAIVTSYAHSIYLCLGDDIFRILKRIESNPGYCTTLVLVEPVKHGLKNSRHVFVVTKPTARGSI